MSLVIDASIAIAWAAQDEFAPIADHAMEVVKASGGVVPPLWYHEISNIVLMNERKGRINREEADTMLQSFGLLPIEVDGEAIEQAFRGTVELARTHCLTIYDAAYLELALRGKLPLASLDRELVDAARIEGALMADA